MSSRLDYSPEDFFARYAEETLRDDNSLEFGQRVHRVNSSPDLYRQILMRDHVPPVGTCRPWQVAPVATPTRDFWDVFNQRRTRRGGQLLGRIPPDVLHHWICETAKAGRYPSPGAMYAVQLHVIRLQAAADGGPDVSWLHPREGRLYHRDITLDPMRFAQTYRGRSFGAQSQVVLPAVVLVATAAYQGTLEKYGPRALRFIHNQWGVLLEALQLTATAWEIAAMPHGGGRDLALLQFLKLSPIKHIYVGSMWAGLPRPRGEVPDEDMRVDLE